MAQDDFLQFQERVKQAESRGRRYDKNGNLLTSPKGAQGEMQVMPATQRSPGFGITPAKDRSPEEIARVGTDYLATMKKRYGDETLAAIAYNMGPGATDKWLAAGADFSKLPAETQGYVQKVMGKTPSAPATASTPASQPTPSEQIVEPALRSGMTASAEDLGSGYKAALALSFLGADEADKPETDEDLQARLDKEEEDTAAAELAAYKPKNAFADLKLSATSHLQPVHRANGSPITGEDPQQEAIDEMLSEQPRSFLSRASEAVQSAARQGLDAMFPIRRVVRTGVEPTAKEAMQKFEQAVKDDPQAYLENKSFGEDLASRAHFHIKNAGRRAMGLEPFKDESRVYLGPITEDSFPNPNNPIPPELRTSTGLPVLRRSRFADGGDVGADEPMMADIPEQSTVNVLRAANKQRIGDKDIESMMLGLGIDKASLGLNLSNLRQNDKDNLARSLMAAYNTQLGDVGVNASIIRPIDAPPGVYMGNVGASYPVGEGRVMAGVNAMRTPEGETRTMGHNLGYSGKVGPGYLNATIMQPKGNPQGRQYQMQYAVPFADGGDVVSSSMPLNPNPMAGTPEMMLWHGGVVHRADGSPMGGEELEPLEQRSTDMGYANTKPPTRSAQQLQAYMESMNPTVRVDQRPLERGLLGYVEPEPVLGTPGQPNVLNINTQQSPGTAETTKLHELEHTMDLRGGDIRGRPNVRYTDNNMRAYYLMDRDWRPINQTVENIVNNKEKIEQFFGRPIESGYFRAKSLENLKSEGEQKALFKEQIATLSALEQATGKSLTQDPEMRNIFPSTKMMAVYDALTGPRQTRLDARDLPPHTPQPSYMYETNPVMRFLKEKLGSKNEYGVPVRRADGSPETGEMGPYIGNPNIQRQGVAAKRLAAMRDVNTLPDPRTYAAVSGFLGTPPDEQGFSVLHPDLAGIKKAGEAGFGLGIGAAVAPVVGPVAKTVGKMAGSALNERMLSGQSLTPGFNTPAAINFAVKPEQGGFFLTSSRTGSDEVDSFLRHFAGVPNDSKDPLTQWVYKRYSNYMRGPMGTEADPFVKGADAGRHFHFMDQQGQPFRPQYANSVPYVRQTMGLPEAGFAKTSTGQAVETAIDASINPIAVKDVGDLNLSPKMKELAAKNPDAPVYEILMEEMDNVLKPEELKMSLRAMLEDKTLPPEYRITTEQLQKMTLLDASEKVAKFDQYIAAKEGQDLLQKSEKLPVYKQYDDGYRWLAPNDVREDDRSKRFVLQAGKNARWCTEKESSCLDYASGDSRVLILSDPNGKPAVQMNILTVPSEERVYDWLQTLPHSQAEEIKDKMYYYFYQVEELPEFKQWLRAQPVDEIGEIKGRYNETNLTGESLAKARDVVRSGNWARVKDLENVQLTDADHLYSKDVIDNIIMPKFGTRYLTDSEIDQIRPLLPENKATGGMIERRSDDNRRYL